MDDRVVRMIHEGYFLKTPSRGVHDLTEEVTSDEDLFLVTHMGLAHVDPRTWFLEVSGLVDRPRRFNLKELSDLPRHEVVSVHECAGSPLVPREPKRRVGNVTWSGCRLVDVLDLVGLQERAAFVWSAGLEWGEFAGLKDEPFVKDLPVEKALRPEVLLATHLNGVPLSDARGGPVRLVVPGWYGTNSVKWLGSITVESTRAPGPFTTRFYNDDTPEGRVPVWGIAPESIIVAPTPEDTVELGTPIEVWGWSWAESGIKLVEVSSDGGMEWHAADLGPRRGHSWQRFSWTWTPNREQTTLLCRCIDAEGRGQPETGWRNAVHSVQVRCRP